MSKQHRYWVYILSSFSKVIYIGVTNSLVARKKQHRQESPSGFCQKYNCHHLVYYEEYSDIYQAIAREKQLKRWRRDKKISLIEKKNPNWDDLISC